MGRRDAYDPGLFCWIDVATPDPAASLAFYGHLFGWTARELPGDYWMLELDGAVVAGLGRLSEREVARGIRPAWSNYVAVEDAAMATACAGEHGGSTLVDAFEIEGFGHMAVIADPQGAVLSLWQAAPFAGAEVVNQPGTLTWNDLRTTVAPAEAAAYYRALFGWRIEEVPLTGGTYFRIDNGDRANGGIMRSGQDGLSPLWMPYFGVDDLEAAMERVRGGGGDVLTGPVQAGPGGRFAACREPQGAMFSLFAGAFED
jgi:predicted enzyme related to lactoylglutathione lyase